MQEKAVIEAENKSLKYQVESLTSQLEAFERTKRREIDELRSRLDEANYHASKVSSLSGQKDRMDSEIRSLQRENQRLTDAIQMKNHEIEELYYTLRSLETQNNLKSKFSTIAEY